LRFSSFSSLLLTIQIARDYLLVDIAVLIYKSCLEPRSVRDPSLAIFLFAFTFCPYRSDELGAGKAVYFPSSKKIKQELTENTFCF